MDKFTITHLKELESESIYVLREVAAQFEHPAILFSGGKDSIVVTYLAYKAFYPLRLPFPLLHIDTGHNFQETLDYRDELVKKLDAQLIIGSVQQSIDEGESRRKRVSMPAETSCRRLRCSMPLNGTSLMLLLEVPAAMRRRPGPRNVFSVTVTSLGNGILKISVPNFGIFSMDGKIWGAFRIFPISNWTEMDVWQYILLEKIPMPSLYFSHQREVFEQDGQWLAVSPFIKMKPTEHSVSKLARCRTIGDVTCTGLTLSKASTVEDIIDEIAASRVTERGGRADDKRSETAMEDRKKAGYF